MLKALTKGFRDYIRETPDLYDFKFIELDDIKRFPDGLKDMHLRNFDGMVIRNVFNSVELEQIKEGFHAIANEKLVHIREGRAYPPVFAQLLRNVEGRPDDHKNIDKFTNYFQLCEKFGTDFKEEFGVDFQGKVESIFRAMSGGRNVEVPKGFDSKGRYAFGTIRCLIPNTGEMSVHTGNYFRDSCAEFYEHLETQVKTYDQLSYFVTVQKAEKGGGLTLYDIEWKDGQTKSNPGENRYVTDVDGTQIDILGIKRRVMTVNPNAGDLLIFNGAQIWHRVEIVEGNTDRITFGGFMSFTEDESKVMYWS